MGLENARKTSLNQYIQPGPRSANRHQTGNAGATGALQFGVDGLAEPHLTRPRAGDVSHFLRPAFDFGPWLPCLHCLIDHQIADTDGATSLVFSHLEWKICRCPGATARVQSHDLLQPWWIPMCFGCSCLTRHATNFDDRTTSASWPAGYCRLQGELGQLQSTPAFWSRIACRGQVTAILPRKGEPLGERLSIELLPRHRSSKCVLYPLLKPVASLPKVWCISRS